MTCVDFSFRVVVVGGKTAGKRSFIYRFTRGQFPMPEKNNEKLDEALRKDVEKMEWETFYPPHLKGLINYPTFQLTKGSLAGEIKNVSERRRRVKLDMVACHRIRQGGSDPAKDKKKHPFEYQSSYFRGVIVMYSVTSKKSFKEAEIWLIDVETFAPYQVRTVLLASKYDCVGKSEVTKVEGENLAAKHKAIFFETSCWTSKGIDEALRACATMMVQGVER
mmetsp:Transcript_21377/g.23880  ORF Transcript_21377/g.23880 Transcript_21377/m.23880 type:complete len:221 (+) Transcript_21377:38-700(+)